MPAHNGSGRFVSSDKGEVSIHWDDDSLDEGLTRLLAGIVPYVDAVLEHDEAESINDMRTSAPWTDRTSNARNGLFAKAYVEGGEHGEILYHTVEYGIFLETKFSGRDRVVWPDATLRAGRRVMTGIRMLMRSL